MNFPQLSSKLSNTGIKFVKGVRRNAPTILLVSGLASGASSLYFTAKATAKSVREIDAEEEELTGGEIFKKVWKNYIMAFVTAGGSAACFIGMHSIHKKRIAALMMAYKASEATLLKYQDKIIDTFGKKEEAKVREEMAVDEIKENPPTRDNITVIDYDGEIIYDPPNKRYYQVRTDRIYRAFMEINTELLVEKVYLNRYYELVGLDEMDIGDVYVWTPTADGLEVSLVGCDSSYNDIGKPAFKLSIWPPYGLDTEVFER